MTYTSTIKRLLLALALFLFAHGAGGQSLYDYYDFSTGVNPSLWKDMTGATTLNLSGDDNAYTTLIPIGFNFNLAGNNYQNWTVNTNGCIRLGDFPVNSTYSSPLSNNINSNLPKLVVLGCDGYMVSGNSYVKYKLFGTTPETRLLVIEYRLSTYTSSTRNYPVTVQIQLKEWDRSITYVFGEPPSVAPGTSYQMGVAATAIDIVEFNTTNNSATFLNAASSYSNPSGTWPAQYRFYKLTYNPSLCFFPGELTVENIDTTNATVRWTATDPNDFYRVCVDNLPCQDVTGDHVDLYGLAPGAVHDITVRRFCSPIDSSRAKNISFRTPNIPASGCIDPTDFQSGYCTAYYGDFNNPYANVGVVDYGHSSSTSRHTVHTNTNERDPRTNNQLRTVPPDGTASVRLGNWMTGSEAEAIQYEMRVDTTISDLLILQYAAVLQDPNHPSNQQPRFRLEILNSSMQLIDPMCGAADFIANSNLEWNTNGSLLWKDWTTVGIDLAPYAGQIIIIRLTTYDCSQSGHYGYAYFTLSCGRKNMQSESCGNNISNTFTVPAGFNYLWYTDSPSHPISNSRSLNVTTDSSTIYHCLLSFVDKPQCNFVMSAYAGVRYPLSLFDTTMSVYNCQFDVNFINQSTISADGVTPSGSGESCETAWWNFGNGDTSSLYHASTHYDHPGTYTVTLVSTIANGLCADTLQRTINVLPPGPNPTFTGPTDRCEGSTLPDTLTIQHATWNSTNSDIMIVAPTTTTTYTISATDSSNCLYTLDHTITIHPSYHHNDSTVICPNELPLTYGNITITDASDTGSYSYIETSIHGCDSINTLFLTVNDTNSADTMAVACENFNWYGTTYTSSGAVASRVTTNAAGCDSTTTLRLTLLHSTYASFHDTVVQNDLPHTFNGASFSDSISHTAVTISNTNGCDSIIDYSLFVHWNVYTPVDSTVCDNQLPVSWNRRTFTSAGTQNDTLLNRFGADSIVIMTLHVNPTYNDTLTANICNNQTYSFENSVYDAAGTYSHLLTSSLGCDSLRTLVLTLSDTIVHTDIIDTCDSFLWHNTLYTANTIASYPAGLAFTGCDSTDYLYLTLRYSSSSIFYDTVVENDLPHLFNGISFNDSLSHSTVTVTNSAGCDSIIDYSLFVHWNVYTPVDSTICDDLLPLTWNHRTFTAAGTLNDTLQNRYGADSIVIMTLHVNPTYNDTFYVSICNNQSYPFENLTHDSAGIYSYLFTSSNGCDSLRTLALSLRDTTTRTDTIDICDQFLWHDSIYTHSAIDTFYTGLNVAGCDSTDYLYLYVRHSTASSFLDTVVENQLPRLFNGTSFTDSVNHTTVTISNAANCDSLIDYSLHVFWNVDTTLYDSLCNSSLPISWNTVTFDTTLSQTSATLVRTTVFTAHTGADSVITMHLTVHPLYDHHSLIDICDNEQYTFGDSVFLGSNGSTVHLDSLLSIHSCDSLSTLHLTVHPTFDHHTYDTICSNQTIVFTNNTYNTTGTYPTLLKSQHQCDSLSTLHLQVWPAYDLHTYDTLCDDTSRFFVDTTYRQTGTYPHLLFTSHSCDSLETLHLKVYPTYDLHTYDTIYDGDTYLFESTLYDTTGIYPHMFSATFGCDSLRTLHLQRNRRTYVDSTVCQNSLPLLWNGALFTNGGGTYDGYRQTLKDSVHLSGLNGIDSLVVMTVTAKDTSASVDMLHGCDSLLWLDDILYTASTSAPFITLLNHLGCDSVHHLALTVDYTHHFTDRIDACDSLGWIDGNWYFRDTAGTIGPIGSHLVTGPVDTLVTHGGCDSVVTLDLRIHHATYEESIDTFCFNQTYSWRHFNIHNDNLLATLEYYLTDTLQTIYHCDSVLAMRLTQMAKPSISFSYEHDCGNLSYHLSGTTDVNYLHWSSVPYDPLIDSHEHDSTITVMPKDTTDYILYADYHETPLCPTTDQIRLYPITIPEAVLQVNPEALEYNAMDYDAYDASLQYVDRTWYIDWVEQDETSRHLHGQGPTDQDSLVIALSVYNGQCYDTAIRVLPILRVLVLAPNVFTPDLDINNRFTIFVDGVIDGELFIYNREGLLVYRTTDFEHQGWDGHGCPQGNYVWKLDYHAIDYPTVLKSTVGSILLLR